MSKNKESNGLPNVTVLEITEISIDGDVFALPVKWDKKRNGPPPRIEIQPDDKGHPALIPGDKVLAQLTLQDDGTYEARTIQHLGSQQKEDRVIGLIKKTKTGFVLQSTNKKDRKEYRLSQTGLDDVKDGDLVIARTQSDENKHHRKATITEIIGRHDDPKAISLISLHETGLRSEFSEAVLKETENMKVPELGNREDLRNIPLVTIDGADARDFDDAVFAEKTDEGFHLIVAIADVAHYVRPGSALDEEAYLRSNSTYFPDRVLPMLPETLSNGLCSLKPHEDRACMAMHMWINNEGQLQKHKIVRALMRSTARLTYEQVQAAKDGITDDTTAPLMKDVINPLYAAYTILRQAREKRGALDLDLPERRVIVDKKGNVTDIRERESLDSNKLIEEFMVAANVASAERLEEKTAPCVYRIHDRPNPVKLESTREFLDAFDFSLPKGEAIQPQKLNQILHKAANHPHSHLISQTILRAQAQARYSRNNIGHFGLALPKYAHFTSPIRRYADLLVHRSLIKAYNLGTGELSEGEAARLEEITDHISSMERLSVEAERNAVDRFTASFLSEQIGADFTGRISGVTRFGLFVRLDGNGADGLIPVRTLPRDNYIHDENRHALIGRHDKRLFRLGAPVTVRLTEANGLSGNTILALSGSSLEGADIPGATFKKSGKNPGKKSGNKSGPSRHSREDNNNNRKKHKGKGGDKGRGRKNKGKGPRP